LLHIAQFQAGPRIVVNYSVWVGQVLGMARPFLSLVYTYVPSTPHRSAQ